MQEVEGVINGTYDYTKLGGDTGPLVYAFHCLGNAGRYFILYLFAKKQTFAPNEFT